MLSALLAGALIVAASLLLGSAIMAIAGLPRHSAAGPATGISALLVICGVAIKLPGHAVTAAVAVGLALIGCFVVFGRARAPAGSCAHRCGRRRGRRCAGGGDPVRDQRPYRHPRPGPGQRRHGLPSALHRVDHDARRPDPGPDQGRLPARPPRDRRRHDQGERSQLRRGLRRADRGDRRPPGADRLRSAPRRPRLAAGAGGGAGGEPLPGGGLPVAGRLQGAAARPRRCSASRWRCRRLLPLWSVAQGSREGRDPARA